jgi:hypothetical protein
MVTDVDPRRISERWFHNSHFVLKLSNLFIVTIIPLFDRHTVLTGLAYYSNILEYYSNIFSENNEIICESHVQNIFFFFIFWF